MRAIYSIFLPLFSLFRPRFAQQHASALLVLVLVLVFTLTACPGPGGTLDAGQGPEVEPGFITAPFPSDFAWGTNAAQWQAEGDVSATGGDPVQSSWSRWLGRGKAVGEQLNPEGNEFTTLYEADLDRAADLGLGVFRYSVDWSRIEPMPGMYDVGEIDHVVDILQAAKDRGLNPVLTYWHWVVPAWVSNSDSSFPEGTVDLMSNADRGIVDAFEAFVRQVTPRVKGLVDIYTVLNEPFTVISSGYLNGEYPPGRFLDVPGGTRFAINLLYMQAAAYDAIKEIDDEDADGDGNPAFVGFTQAATTYYPANVGNAQEELAADSVGYVANDWPVIAITTGDLDVNLDGDTDDLDTDPPEGNYPELAGKTDFIGLQYYGPIFMVQDTLGILDNFHPIYAVPGLDVDDFYPELPHNGKGRAISAADFRAIIEHYAQWNLPLIITENGTTTNLRPVLDDDENLTDLPRDEAQAAMYLIEHLWEVGRALEAGYDIRGYYHAVLADNFEWTDGLNQRFGAYAVDFESAEKTRTLTLMGQAFKDVVEAGEVNEEIWNRYVLERYPTDTREEGGLTTSGPVYTE